MPGGESVLRPATTDVPTEMVFVIEVDVRPALLDEVLAVATTTAEAMVATALPTPVDSWTADSLVEMPIATQTPAPTTASQGTADGAPSDETTVESSAGGPHVAVILEPPDPYSSSGPTLFAWIPDTALERGQGFEVIFWNPQIETEEQAKGWERSTTETSLEIPPQGPGTYMWTLYLVAAEPYQRLRRLAGPFTLSVVD
jgi:hypothetical protein